MRCEAREAHEQAETETGGVTVLQRQPRPASRRERRRRDGTRAERDRRYRRRLARGVMTVMIEIDAAIIDRLVQWHWLEPRDVHERDEIARAIAAMLADAAKRG